VVEVMDRAGVGQAAFFGYSLGGYVALSLAQARPELVLGVATLGTKFYWDTATAARETALLDPKTILAKVPAFAERLRDRHTAAGWEAVCHETAGLLWALADLGGFRSESAARVPVRVRVMIGDRDATADLAESAAVARALPHGELEVLPGAPHPLEKAPLDRLAYSLGEFFGAAGPM
jgi:pimeloyl-ACP methyl ester carboxylesterase